MFLDHTKNSKTNTTIQHSTEMENNPAPHHANRMPKRSAAKPDHMLPVALRMAGKVITANVT